MPRPNAVTVRRDGRVALRFIPWGMPSFHVLNRSHVLDAANYLAPTCAVTGHELIDETEFLKVPSAAPDYLLVGAVAVYEER